MREGEPKGEQRGESRGEKRSEGENKGPVGDKAGLKDNPNVNESKAL